jgi:hypothetical protein
MVATGCEAEQVESPKPSDLDDEGLRPLRVKRRDSFFVGDSCFAKILLLEGLLSKCKTIDMPKLSRSPKRQCPKYIRQIIKFTLLPQIYSWSVELI